jgi:3-deoxy-7-phosphoheptulonate synthase
MFHLTDDLRVREVRPLIPPSILAEEIPVSEVASDTVSAGRAMAEAIVRGQDDRLLCVVGPCSIHDPEAALEYGGRLADLAPALARDLLLVMRVYFEKPRTTVGWKGLINDPGLDDSFAINRGLRDARGLLLRLAERGVPAATEFLDTITPQFIADLVAWGAIGARTTESQVHRQLASGLSMPVGFKNGTDGDLGIARDAVRAARVPHHFMGVTKQGIAAIVATRGNDACHVILRGGSKTGPNYDAARVDQALALLLEAKLAPRVMIDCSHENSSKRPERQPLVAEAIASQLEAGQRGILGMMLESHLVAGRQDLHADRSPLTYGQSITDACLGWEDTEAVLRRLARAVEQRRRQAGATP